MFREFLLSRAAQTYTDECMAGLKKAAARLLEADGQIEAAIELLFESGEQREVLQLILSQAQNMIIQGRRQTLEQWLLRFPGKTHPQASAGAVLAWHVPPPH